MLYINKILKNNKNMLQYNQKGFDENEIQYTW